MIGLEFVRVISVWFVLDQVDVFRFSFSHQCYRKISKNKKKRKTKAKKGTNKVDDTPINGTFGI